MELPGIAAYKKEYKGGLRWCRLKEEGEKARKQSSRSQGSSGYTDIASPNIVKKKKNTGRSGKKGRGGGGREKNKEGTREKKKGKPRGFPENKIPAASYFPTTSRLQYHRPWRA